MKLIFWVTLFFFSTELFSQNQFVYGNIKDLETNSSILGVEIYVEGSSLLLSRSDKNGYFEFFTKENSNIVFFSAEYKTEIRRIIKRDSLKIDVSLERLSIELNEIEVNEKRNKLFEIAKLEDVVETSIYAGKKSEVILLNQTKRRINYTLYTDCNISINR